MKENYDIGTTNFFSQKKKKKVQQILLQDPYKPMWHCNMSAILKKNQHFIF